MAGSAATQKIPSTQANNVKRMKGKPARFRLRVGDYRVLFALEADEIHVLDIGPRGSIYD